MEERCHDLIDYFNGTLSAADRDAFEAHLATCDDCKQALQEMQDLMLPIAESLPERPIPTGMKSRILGEVLGSTKQGPEPVQEPVEKSAVQKTAHVSELEAARSKKEKKRVPLGWLMSIAAALILSLGANAYFLSQDESSPAEEFAMDEVKGMGNFESTASIKGSSMIFTKDDQEFMLVQLKDLPPLKKGELYQLWTIQGDTPRANGVIEQDGEAAAVFPIKGDGTIDAVAITVEPEPDLEKPTGEVVASVTL
ncbi:anti-sigma factor [Exiguobacterium artemiae]|uniref:anti-sigma factor n=1 Tax=Exiguobacterium artemiae TaxID=340145 RepID=UPI002963D69A|nr:anti-sigma factor [Exiguobacterium sibiricum]MDW2887152.1 anti-sigma factor [Exiguobacterium sibiricum]